MPILEERLRRAEILAKANMGRSVVALNPDYKKEALQKCGDAEIFGVKNTNGIPRAMVNRLRKREDYLWLTVDKMSDLGRSVDTDLVNPLTYRPMTGSTSGGAVNILKGITDVCLGTDGGGSVLAPALAACLPAFMGNGIGLHGGQGRSTDGLPFTTGVGVIGRQLDEVVKTAEILYGAPLQSEPLPPTVTVAIPAPGCMTLPGGEDGNAVLRTYLEKLPHTMVAWEWQETVWKNPYDRTELSRQLTEKMKQDPLRLYLSFEGPIDVFTADETIPRAFGGPAPAQVAGVCGKGFVKAANPCGCSAFALPSDRLAAGFVLLCPPGAQTLPSACVLAQALMQASPRPDMFARYFLRREKFCDPFLSNF